MADRDLLRVVQIGAGAMGRAWLHAVARSPEVELVGLVDLDLHRARAAAEDTGHRGLPVAMSLADLTGGDPQAAINVTIPTAHRAISTEALLRGLPVLCEKPLASSVSECLALVAVAELTGRLLMVSQSRRYWRTLTALRGQLERLGPVSTVGCEFFRAPRFGGFREEMAYPLLLDMAIHQFDLARLLLGSDPVSVYCESYNPAWSWFAGDAAATALFTFASGERFTFTGSWVAPSQETSWNGRWRISAEHGTAVWDGDSLPVAFVGDQEVPAHPGTGGEQIDGSLAEFVAAVRGGPIPATEAHHNVVSVAMVEAAIASAVRGQRVLLDQQLESAHRAAMRTENDPRVREVLASWSSVRDALGAAGQPGPSVPPALSPQDQPPR